VYTARCDVQKTNVSEAINANPQTAHTPYFTIGKLEKPDSLFWDEQFAESCRSTQ